MKYRRRSEEVEAWQSRPDKEPPDWLSRWQDCDDIFVLEDGETNIGAKIGILT